MNEKGQALAEFAVVTPVLVMFLAAAGYFGHAVSIQQQLTVAAGAAARQAAIASTQTPRQRTDNSYANDLTGEQMRAFALEAVPGLNRAQLQVEPPDFVDAAPFGNGFAALFSSDLGGAQVGAVLYGCKLRYPLQELRPLARILGLRDGFAVEAVGVSAGELPLRLKGSRGLLDLNRDLFQSLLQP